MGQLEIGLGDWFIWDSLILFGDWFIWDSLNYTIRAWHGLEIQFGHVPERLSLHGHQNDILSKLW
jgi:hypothetical protein